RGRLPVPAAGRAGLPGRGRRRGALVPRPHHQGVPGRDLWAVRLNLPALWP
ncbi:unnamed protein product, partial [Heterosigma akashiwo]